MIAGHLRRLEKMEKLMLPASGEAAVRLMTTDELEVAILTIAADCPTSDEPPNEWSKRVAGTVAEIKAGILEQAQLRCGPDHDVRAAQQAPFLNGQPYVTAVTPGGEYDALSIPRLMARRAALWANPVVVRVIETAEQAA